MKILKYSIIIFLQKRGNTEPAIRIDIRWSNLYYRFSFGVSYPPEHFKNGRCVRGTRNAKGYSAQEINAELDTLESSIQNIFARYRDNDIIPTAQNIKSDIQIIKGGDYNAESLEVLWNAYLSSKSNWAYATISKNNQLKRDVLTNFPGISLNKINTDEFIANLAKLYIDRGYNPSTNNKYISNLNGFLNWLFDKKYIKDKPKIKKYKELHKPILFLTQEELQKLIDCELPEAYSRERDVFVFQCLTGVRDSDIRALSTDNIHGDRFIFTTRKTTDTITIPLAIKAQEILNKYHDTNSKIALPVKCNQERNRQIKIICTLAGINSSWNYEEIQGRQRVQKTGTKAQFVTTHTARKTFVCLALSLGITPNVIMKITGHSNYEAMAPYIGIASKDTDNAISTIDKAIGGGQGKSKIELLEEQVAKLTSIIEQINSKQG